MEKKNRFLSLENVVPRIFGVEFPSPINWQINYGEQWAVIGPTGSGKTLLGDLIAGKYGADGEIKYLFWDDFKAKITGEKYAAELIRKIGFESAYLLADYKSMYYQQRFNSTENDRVPTVQEVLSQIPIPHEEKSALYEKLNLASLLTKHLIMLSSGELRRFLIAIVLMQKPDLIIFDNPFIGLDKEMCTSLNEFFKNLGQYLQMIFLIPAATELPDVVSHVLLANNLTYGPAVIRAEFPESRDESPFMTEDDRSPVHFPKQKTDWPTSYQTVVKMTNVNVKYGSRVILENINWEIKKGEKWALLGPNGSGKSMLLSLMVGDNPQAYAQRIEIFGRRRGTGESIWEIKRPIGYISSEMHLYFQENQPVKRIVASGFFDTIGLFRQCDEEQEQISREWMKLLGIDYLAEKSFLKISGGEQRLALLARTLVKNPDFLILDEPFHGLDSYYKKRVRNVIENFCIHPDKTLIYVTHRREEIPNCVDHFFELVKK